MATIKLKFRPSSVPETEGTLYYQVSGDTQAKSEVDKHWVSCIPI